MAQTELPLGTLLGADGIEPLTKMREIRQWKLIPVVMITAEGSQQRALAAVDPGAAGYVRVRLEIAGHTMTKD